MNLKELIHSIPGLEIKKSEDLNMEVNQIFNDSRKVSSRDIFIQDDSIHEENLEKYLKNSSDNECNTVILKSSFLSLAKKFNFKNIIIFDEGNHYFGKIASILYGNPSSKLKIIAVTGTNGKTSISQIIYQFLINRGFKTGIIGTIFIQYPGFYQDSINTTPDASTLQKILFDMVTNGTEYLVMEASSHGLKLGRMDGIEIDVGIFSNLTQDHLDFHKTMEDYFNAKKYLFTLLENSSKQNKLGIIYIEDDYGKRLHTELSNSSFRRIAIGDKGEYQIENSVFSTTSTKFNLKSKTKIYPIHTSLLGKFNTINLALSILGVSNFAPLEEWLSIVDKIQPIQGRFQIIPLMQKNSIAIVDYAHTPDALENILTTAKNLNPTQLVCVFGCGGDRDRTKRPIMTKISFSHADHSILTQDNPRTEDSEQIFTDMLENKPKTGQSWETIPDRRMAIWKGVCLSQENSILLIAGKGHETYQIFGKKKVHFDDVEEVKKALSFLKNFR
jgi:UDP-N-acetylmuramoyl-L-alanyl-D-glutamate--2,6-diaminopimelate ligase